MKCSQKRKYATLSYAQKQAIKMSKLFNTKMYAYKCSCGACHLSSMNPEVARDVHKKIKKSQENRIIKEADYWEERLLTK